MPPPIFATCPSPDAISHTSTGSTTNASPNTTPDHISNVIPNIKISVSATDAFSDTSSIQHLPTHPSTLHGTAHVVERCCTYFFSGMRTPQDSNNTHIPGVSRLLKQCFLE
jgi:hypothetical protein